MQDQVKAESKLEEAATPAPESVAGLSEAEANRRLAEYGENALAEHRVSVLERLARFFWGPIPWMIEAAAVLSAVLGHWADLAIILAMLFINAGVGRSRPEDIHDELAGERRPPSNTPFPEGLRLDCDLPHGDGEPRRRS